MARTARSAFQHHGVSVSLSGNTQRIMRDHAPLGRLNAGALASFRWQPHLRWAATCGFAAKLDLLCIGGTGEFHSFQS